MKSHRKAKKTKQAQEIQMLGSMPRSKGKVKDNKMRMPHQSNKKGKSRNTKKKKGLKDTMSQVNDSDPKSLKP
jgi:hypothetical protein